jgi:hypothetical protein
MNAREAIRAHPARRHALAERGPPPEPAAPTSHVTEDEPRRILTTPIPARAGFDEPEAVA